MDIAYDLDKCPLNTSPMNIRVNSLDGKTNNPELVNKVKEEFLSNFRNKQRQVIPLMF